MITNRTSRVFLTFVFTVWILNVPGVSAVASDLSFSAKPQKVVVNQSYENIDWSLHGDQVSAVDAVDVQLEHVATRSLADLDFTSGGEVAGTLRLYDYERPGRYVVYGQAWDADLNELAVAPAYVTAKFDARSKLTARRQGSLVTLTAKTQRYSGGYPLWVGHRNAEVRYQRFVRGAWRTFATRTVPRAGVTQVTVRRVTPLRYRVVSLETKRVWRDVSKPVRR
jgi:hypothetical protein